MNYNNRANQGNIIVSKTHFQKFSLIILTLLMAACSNQVQKPSTHLTDFNLIPDVEMVCKKVSQKYVYFKSRAEHWPETCERAKKEAALLDGERGSLAVLERMVDDLYDPHISLNTNTQDSPRLVPSGSDLWFKKTEESYTVSAVRPLSGAAKAGVQIEDELVSFNGMTPYDLASTRIHSGKDNLDNDRLTWAINAAVAGRHANPRNIKIRRGNDLLSFELEAPEVPKADEPISHKIIAEHVGYIRFNNSLGRSSSVSAFNVALEALRQTDGLIIDLRETPGGGNTGVAEPIMGRFIEKKTAYQRTVFQNGLAKDRKIEPSGPWTYDKPIVVLVGRWTGSMGEGMAIGFDGMRRGKVMGSQMAGLAGGTESINLKERGISISFPTYDLHHLNGTPRHNWEPSEIVTADNGAEEDTLLRSAILEFQSE